MEFATLLHLRVQSTIPHLSSIRTLLEKQSIHHLQFTARTISAFFNVGPTTLEALQVYFALLSFVSATNVNIFSLVLSKFLQITNRKMVSYRIKLVFH